ncbi:H-NS family nucleoid-associated regulatory protein [uncultured Endozoicomonas sp.]|uniref:H-NS family histone-like protein n=1 Tax=uncultured Endozoicomonas sp. TaxID=432652 RepID=UPI00262BA8FB|nr:H-NS family nucleoid-associated regulatory protein [uncultured Endozoicomonas sp.]
MKLLDELHHRLSSKTRIRSLFKEASVQDLEKILARLNEVYTEKLQSREQEDLERQRKKDDITAIQKKMSDLGLTLSDLDVLSDTTISSKRRRTSKKYIFQYENAKGDTVSWEGSSTGRLPKEFQEYLEKYQKKRAECIVE